ncbi:MAG: hypothetical protein K2Q21_01795 [Chitinophagaceae bacterium]|nr:hypothetical protein [Chitinophagaceae bacterium]
MYTMKPIVIAILAGAALLFLFSCDEPQKNEDITNDVNKSGAIESAVKVQRLDSLHDILITTHAVWVNNSILKNIEYRDTLPSLGEHYTTAENQDGDTKQVRVKKDYEIYITVK